jgi:NAD(P)-dependent dehydrogenase (short-subunit alcohol dehydrogenase family)
MRIEHSVALVTGANRGLGRAFVEELLARGAGKVYAGMRTVDATAVPGAVPIQLDVTDPESVRAAAETCSDVTLLVNNAGAGSLHEGVLDPSLIDVARDTMDVNFYGVIRVSQALAPTIVEHRGAIVNVLSDATWFALPPLAAYSATKSAAWNFTNALRVELRPRGVEVLGVHAGFIDTDMARGVDAVKSDPRHIAAVTLDELESGGQEVLADAQSKAVKATLASATAYYLDPPGLPGTADSAAGTP